ncbi:MAG: PEPxxWA-CTERM sorting domain-containing protein [Sphingomonadaceae bacterium]
MFPVNDVGPYPILVGAGSVFDGLFLAGQSFTTITVKLFSGATEVASVTSGPLSNVPTFLATGYAGGISKIALSSSAGNGWWVGDDFTFTLLVPYDVIPEPGTWALLIAGFGLVGLAARRRASALA